MDVWDEINFYHRREREERILAVGSIDVAVRKRHYLMAERFANFAWQLLDDIKIP